jgi:hypothetical protein
MVLVKMKEQGGGYCPGSVVGAAASFVEVELEVEGKDFVTWMPPKPQLVTARAAIFRNLNLELRVKSRTTARTCTSRRSAKRNMD